MKGGCKKMKDKKGKKNKNEGNTRRLKRKHVLKDRKLWPQKLSC